MFVRSSAGPVKLRAPRDGPRSAPVSSGAIAEGVLRIGWETRPTRVCELQAAAAVGQMGLAQAYEEHFGRHGIKTAQVLLTHANLADREQYLNARMTLIELLGLGIVPVINENDTECDRRNQSGRQRYAGRFGDEPCGS